MTRIELGQLFRSHRLQRRLSQEQVSKSTSIHTGEISRVELGSTSVPIRSLRRYGFLLCQFYGLSQDVVRSVPDEKVAHAPVAAVAPPDPLRTLGANPTRTELLAAIAHLHALVPKAPSWAGDQAKAGLEEFLRNPKLKSDSGEPEWFVEFQRRLEPHIEAEARLMLEECL